MEIGKDFRIQSLLDLGASVNILPTYLYNHMDLGKYKPTNITLQLADRSTRRCRGIVEDVIVKCVDFYYPVDFVLLDTNETPDTVPIILGRPFLATADAIISCHSGNMQLAFRAHTRAINIYKSMEKDSSVANVCCIDSMECADIDDLDAIFFEKLEQELLAFDDYSVHPNSEEVASSSHSSHLDNESVALETLKSSKSTTHINMCYGSSRYIGSIIQGKPL